MRPLWHWALTPALAAACDGRRPPARPAAGAAPRTMRTDLGSGTTGAAGPAPEAALNPTARSPEAVGRDSSDRDERHQDAREHAPRRHDALRDDALRDDLAAVIYEAFFPTLVWGDATRSGKQTAYAAADAVLHVLGRGPQADLGSMRAPV